jgi:hypothetical protein
MKQEIVLPKFKIPGQTSWLVRGLWIAGGLVAIQVVAMGFYLWDRNTKALQEQTRIVAAREQAAIAAQQQVAAAAAAAPPSRVVPRAESPAIPATTTMAAAPRGPERSLSKPVTRAGLKARYKGKGAYRGSHASARKKPAARPLTRNQLLARSEARRAAGAAAARGGKTSGRTPAKASAKRGDAIDDILRKFK